MKSDDPKFAVVDGIYVQLTSDQIEKIKQQKASKQYSPEERILNILSEEFTVKFRKGYISYYKNQNCAFQIDLSENKLYCYWLLWEMLREDYGCNLAESKRLIKKVLAPVLGYTGDFIYGDNLYDDADINGLID